MIGYTIAILVGIILSVALFSVKSTLKKASNKVRKAKTNK